MNAVETLRCIPWLASLDPESIERVARDASRVTFTPGQILIAELEPGDELFILVEGSAEVTVRTGMQEPRVLAKLGAGDACGEVSLVTHELRSATVTAITEVTALRFWRRDFEELMARHPGVAVHFAKTVACRLRELKGEIKRLVTEGSTLPSVDRLAGRTPAAIGARLSIRRAYNEVVSGRHGMAALALLTFLVVLILERALAWVFEHSGAGLFGLLRLSYTVGFVLLIVSTAASLARFRASWQRWIAASFGAAFALVANGLSVFLAFDVFYLDMTTRDHDLVFDVSALYHRNESGRVILFGLGGVILVLLLRRWLRRSLWLVLARFRRS